MVPAKKVELLWYHQEIEVSLYVSYFVWSHQETDLSLYVKCGITEDMSKLEFAVCVEKSCGDTSQEGLEIFHFERKDLVMGVLMLQLIKGSIAQKI
ncbi:uncharacterized protein [Palaemon carinicauda]|uniref:uncharacterized protein isoform X3 n=1 Tax=Palaemon carinicauda TaxID=392227 RepID=UPI0035B5A806